MCDFLPDRVPLPCWYGSEVTFLSILPAISAAVFFMLKYYLALSDTERNPRLWYKKMK